MYTQYACRSTIELKACCLSGGFVEGSCCSSESIYYRIESSAIRASLADEAVYRVSIYYRIERWLSLGRMMVVFVLVM